MVGVLPVLAVACLFSASPSSPRCIPARDSVILLTVDALTRMSAVWTAILHESPAVLDTSDIEDSDYTPTEAVRLTLHVAPGWTNTVAEVGVDMVALATKFPAVAADLRKAGLTALQWEADRRVLWTAIVSAQIARLNHTTIPSASEVGQNLAFLATHAPALVALQTTGMPVPHMRPGMGADTVVVLTEESMKKLGQFWMFLMAEDPVSIDTMVAQYGGKEEVDGYDAQMLEVCGQTAHGKWPALDVAKLVRRYPDVAADLKRAGLTLQEYENLRKSFLVADLFWKYPVMGKTAPPDSKFAKNMQFMTTHDYYHLVLSLALSKRIW